MTAQETIISTISVCPTDDLAAFLDGELGYAETIEIEQHLRACASCRHELNLQKLFLSELNSSLSADAMPEPPADFARIITANAEGTVTGLSSVRERRNALTVVAFLAMLTLAASVFASGSPETSILGGVDKLVALASAVAGLVQSFSVGVLVLVRSFAVRVPIDLAAMVIVPTLILSLIPIVDRLRTRIERR